MFQNATFIIFIQQMYIYSEIWLTFIVPFNTVADNILYIFPRKHSYADYRMSKRIFMEI